MNLFLVILAWGLICKELKCARYPCSIKEKVSEKDMKAMLNNKLNRMSGKNYEKRMKLSKQSGFLMNIVNSTFIARHGKDY